MNAAVKVRDPAASSQGGFGAAAKAAMRKPMMDATAAAKLTALLAWYRDMGVDAASASAPVDWLQRGNVAPGAEMRERLADAAAPQPDAVAARASPAPQPARRPLPAAMPAPPAAAPAARNFPSASPDASATAARAAAGSAPSLAALHAALTAFDGCGLKATAKNLCLYRGAERARVMLIGEAPGRDEDLEGKPFVGPAGQLLDRMLASIGLDETSVHITNIVYWRPPGNRTPTPQEATVCRPFLERQIELVAPDFIIPLGGAAAKHMLDVNEGIMRVRGRWHDLEIAGRRVRALATLHPAYLLRTPAAKRLAWRDLLTIREALAAA
jgi:uracil-DNA glycosylase family 4